MAARPEGAPCWADAMFPDLEAAKGFYGELLGWTFGESSEEYGNYTQAYSGGKNVAALSPRCPAGKARRPGASTSPRRTSTPPPPRSATMAAS